jgi:hypothetical protein
MSYD